MLFDPAAVDKVIAEHIERPAAELELRRLYTAKEIEALTGITAATIRAERSKGHWPPPATRPATHTAGRAALSRRHWPDAVPTTRTTTDRTREGRTPWPGAALGIGGQSAIAFPAPARQPPAAEQQHHAAAERDAPDNLPVPRRTFVTPRHFLVSGR